MPLLHKIIRHKEMIAGDLVLRHSLDLRHSFLINKEQSCPNQNIPEQATDNPGETNETDFTPVEILAKAKSEAEAILEKANEDAAGILAAARIKAVSEAKKVKTQAAKEGQNKGYKTGMDTALKEVSSIKSEARTVLAQAEEARREKLAHLKDELRALALEIAEKLVNHELQTNSEAVMAIVDESMQMVGNRPYVVLWVHPGDKAICEKHRDQLLGHLPARAELQIMANNEVGQGGCVVETDYSKVDAKLSTRWQSLLAAIKEESE